MTKQYSSSVVKLARVCVRAWSDGSRLTAEEFSSNKLECIMAALIRSLPTQLFESSSTSLAFNDFPPTFFSTVFTTQVSFTHRNLKCVL